MLGEANLLRITSLILIGNTRSGSCPMLGPLYLSSIALIWSFTLSQSEIIIVVYLLFTILFIKLFIILFSLAKLLFFTVSIILQVCFKLSNL